jgi:hypothetical protein
MGLAEDKGDIKALTDKLEGFYRLRVGQHRVVYRHCDGRIDAQAVSDSVAVLVLLAAAAGAWIVAAHLRGVATDDDLGKLDLRLGLLAVLLGLARARLGRSNRSLRTLIARILGEDREHVLK